MRNWAAKMTTPCLNDILLINFTEVQNGYRGLKVVPKLPQTFQNKKLFSLRSKTATEVYRRAGTADLLILGKADAGLPSTCCWSWWWWWSWSWGDYNTACSWSWWDVCEKVTLLKKLKVFSISPSYTCVDRALLSCIILYLISSHPPNPALSQIREVETRSCASLCNKQGDLYLVTCHLTLRHVGLCGY